MSSERCDDAGFLPLALKLAVPFLPSGDLVHLLQVNHACRALALESFQLRLKTPSEYVANPNTPETMVPEYVKAESRETVAPCYRQDQNPWCHNGGPSDDGMGNLWNAKCWKDDTALLENRVYFKMILETSPSGNVCWKVTWEDPSSVPLEKEKSGLLQIPNELAPFRLNCNVTHCSTIGTQLFLVVSKKFEDDEENDRTGADDDDDEEVLSESEDCRKELWGICYHLGSSSRESNNCNETENEFAPLLSQRLTDPIDNQWLGFYEGLADYGQACRSGNGKVFAVVTALVNEETNEDFEEGEAAKIEIFDIVYSSKETSSKQGSVQEFPIAINRRCHLFASEFNFVGDYSGLILSLSTGGEYLSVLNHEKYDDIGGWSVFDLSIGAHGAGNVPLEPLIHVPGCALSHVLMGFFTPDNDFVLCMGNSYHLKRRLFGFNDEDGNSHKPTKKYPRFANRFIAYSIV